MPSAAAAREKENDGGKVIEVSVGGIRSRRQSKPPADVTTMSSKTWTGYNDNKCPKLARVDGTCKESDGFRSTSGRRLKDGQGGRGGAGGTGNYCSLVYNISDYFYGLIVLFTVIRCQFSAVFFCVLISFD